MDTILILMKESRNRQLLEEYLKERYNILSFQDDNLVNADFDLCIIDGITLSDFRDLITQMKKMHDDVFLPFLLVTTKDDIGMLTSGIWQVVDELITTPIQKAELLVRIEVLLRARRLSKELRDYKDAQIRQIKGVLYDIDELRKTMFDNTPLATFYLDIDARVLLWNPSAEDLFGYTASEVLGKQIPIIPPDKKEEFWLIFNRVLNGETIRGLEFFVQKKDGSLIECSLTANAVRNRNGDILGVLANMEDITEHKVMERRLIENQERFRSLFQNNHAVMLVIDPSDGSIVDANPAASKYYGWSIQQLTSMKISDINTLSPDEIKKEMQRAKSFEKNYFQFKHRLSNGNVRDVEVYSGPIKIKGRDLLYSIIFDITERKMLQQQLIQSQKMESIGRLAGGVAHDYNNMLSVIIGYTEMALKKIEPSDPVHSDLMHILKAAERSRDITHQLLTFARKEMISPKLIDINKGIENTLKILQRLIGENIKLVWVPCKDRLISKIDPIQLDQMLANLCVNARDAISVVGTITIQTGKSEFDKEYCSKNVGFLPGRFVWFSVEDDGCGMDKETLQNIYEPFFTTKEIGKGTGLGLSTVYGIVEGANGFIDVKSEVDVGTTFTIYLPEFIEDTPIHTEEKTERIAKGNGETVLVVEDEISILNLLETMLTELNYKVLKAKTPSEAIALSVKHEKDIKLVLTDMVMPEMNGKELIECIKVRCPDIKYIYMTGYTNDFVHETGAKEDNIKILNKPFTLTDLTMIMRSVLDDNKK